MPRLLLEPADTHLPIKRSFPTPTTSLQNSLGTSSSILFAPNKMVIISTPWGPQPPGQRGLVVCCWPALPITTKDAGVEGTGQTPSVHALVCLLSRLRLKPVSPKASDFLYAQIHSLSLSFSHPKEKATKEL